MLLPLLVFLFCSYWSLPAMQWPQFNSSALRFPSSLPNLHLQNQLIQFKQLCNNPLERKAFLYVLKLFIWQISVKYSQHTIIPNKNDMFWTVSILCSLVLYSAKTTQNRKGTCSLTSILCSPSRMRVTACMICFPWVLIMWSMCCQSKDEIHLV